MITTVVDLSSCSICINTADINPYHFSIIGKLESRYTPSIMSSCTIAFKLISSRCQSTIEFCFCFGIRLLLFELLHLFCMHLHWIFIEYIGHFAAQVLCQEPNSCFPFWNVLPVSVPVNIGMQRGVVLRSQFYKTRSMAGQTTDFLELQ